MNPAEVARPLDAALESDTVDENGDKMSQNSEGVETNISFWEYLYGEFRRGYYLENDEQRYEDRREKLYALIKIPKEIERFQLFGLMQCADAFLFIFTVLPIRFCLSLSLGIMNFVKRVVNKSIRGTPVHSTSSSRRLLQPAEICDFLKGFIIIIVAFATSFIDTSVLYHVVKTQSVVKLYIMFNMLEVADRLFSNFGQDVIDTLFWTATEPRSRQEDGRKKYGVLRLFIMALIYVLLHSVLVMCQVSSLNVAINSQSNGLLAIMMSNNFIELKGMVFKKFEKNSLFHMSCSDVRERFHYLVLLFVVVLQTMKEYSWQADSFWNLLPSCCWVIASEILIDWVKHAFVTRFNEIPLTVYSEYITYLAYDVASSKLKNAYSDHSDLVARRMAFIPLPLGALVLRVVVGSVSLNSGFAIVLTGLLWAALFSFKLIVNIILLGRSCVLIERHRSGLIEVKKPVSRLCTSLPPSRRQSLEDIKSEVNRSEIKSEPQSANVSPASSLTDLRDHGDMPKISMDEPPTFAESAVDISTLGIKEEVLGENIDLPVTGLPDIKNRGRSVSTGMLPGLPLQEKKDL